VLLKAGVRQILNDLRGVSPTAERIERISAHFLGLPYRANPLVGSADAPEIFVAALDAFDCVTYVETVWALALAENPRDFELQLRRLRYDSAEVLWTKRNHYMTDWVRNNRRDGLAREIPLSGAPTVKARTLNAVPGLPPKRRRIHCYPRSLALRKRSKIEPGDMILFASTRPDLDVFHVGLVIKKDGRTLLRHASRSQGGVVEQELADFFEKNRMAGIIVARIAPGGRGRK
jgi:hypothetical protein